MNKDKLNVLDKNQIPRKVGLTTLGCKVNQCDSAALAVRLKSAGFEITSCREYADIYILNTCTVTGYADFQARQLIRRVLRINPQARIVITGCYAQTQPQTLAQIEGVSLVVGNDSKEKIAELLSQPAAATTEIFADNIFLTERFFHEPAATVSGRTRAFFKIQDGCNAFCSYCIVPFGRGKSRSLPLSDVLEGVRRFLQQGYREIVLTGIHLGHYGQDHNPPVNFAGALEQILSRHPETRFRLSSIEPAEISEPLLQLFQKHPNLCPHLHIPLQSGDDTILNAMKRTYDTAFYRSLLTRIVQSVPDIAIGVDVLTGFPGEGEAEFHNTLSLIEELPTAYLHVFPYSERPGTAAVKLTPKVSEKTKKDRAAILRDISARKREAFARRFLERTLAVLIENTKDRKTGFSKGLTHNYLPVILDQHDPSFVNRVVSVTILGYKDGKLSGRIVHEH